MTGFARQGAGHGRRTAAARLAAAAPGLMALALLPGRPENQAIHPGAAWIPLSGFNTAAPRG